MIRNPHQQMGFVQPENQHSDALVADGPFRYTRNPLYLASVPMAAGMGVLACLSGFIFLVVANWIFVYRLILREEGALRQSQGRIVSRLLRHGCRDSGHHSGSGFRQEIVAHNGAKRWR